MTSLPSDNTAWGFCGTIGRHGEDRRTAAEAWPLACAAIAATVGRWMGWTIGRRTARETGIPHRLPYLTGFVTMMEVEADAA